LIDLANSFATRGKGDDTSIAGFIDMKTLKQAVPIWKKQIAGEEAAAGKTKKNEAQSVTETEVDLSYGNFITKKRKKT
jgi:hypothetical protein